MPVQLVTEEQVFSLSGTATDVYQITFLVPGRDTVVVFNVPKDGDPVAAAQAQIAAIEAQVGALYGL